MGMQWYVLQVLTGKELAVRDALLAERLPALVPRETAPIRRKGRIVMEERTYIPGYVFLGCREVTPEIYYQATGLAGVVRFLGNPHPQPITATEAEVLALLAPDDKPLPPSTYRIKDGQVDITGGTLARLKDDITRIDRRQRRAWIRRKFIGEERAIRLALVPEGETDGREIQTPRPAQRP